MSVTPVGYIEVKEGIARFRPIFTPDTIVRMQIVAGLLTLLTLGMSRVFGRRRAKRGMRRRGPVFNVVFSPGANVLAGRMQKRPQTFQPRHRMNESKRRFRFPLRIGAEARLFRGIRTLRSKAKVSALP